MQLAQNSTYRRRKGVTVPLELFERLAGRGGTRAWRRCITLRDNRGFVDASYKKLAELDGFEKRSIFTIRNGVDRLHKVGIARFVFDKQTRTARRWVDGVEDESSILVSRETSKKLLKSRKGWSSESKQSLNQSRQNIDESRQNIDESRQNLKNKSRQNSKKIAEIENKKPQQNQQLSSSSYTHAHACAPAHVKESLNPLISSPLRGKEKEGSGAQKTCAGNGLIFKESKVETKEKMENGYSEHTQVLEEILAPDSSEIARDIFLTHPATPPYPALKLIRVPAPPELDPEGAPDDHFRHIASTWMRALEARYSGRCFTFSKAMRNPKKSRFHGILMKAAQQFLAHEISPAAWIAFSFDVWHEYGKHPHTDSPPVPWVFDPKRISERRGWFRKEAARYRGGRILFSKTHRELITRYGHMQSALTRLPISSSDTEVKETIEKYFPGNTYNDLLNRANAIAEDTQNKLYDCLRSGDWLWSEDWQINE